jgi:hypothetical protein
MRHVPIVVELARNRQVAHVGRQQIPRITESPGKQNRGSLLPCEQASSRTSIRSPFAFAGPHSPLITHSGPPLQLVIIQRQTTPTARHDQLRRTRQRTRRRTHPLARRSVRSIPLQRSRSRLARSPRSSQAQPYGSPNSRQSGCENLKIRTPVADFCTRGSALPGR